MVVIRLTQSIYRASCTSVVSKYGTQLKYKNGTSICVVSFLSYKLPDHYFQTNPSLMASSNQLLANSSRNSSQIVQTPMVRRRYRYSLFCCIHVCIYVCIYDHIMLYGFTSYAPIVGGICVVVVFSCVNTQPRQLHLTPTKQVYNKCLVREFLSVTTSPTINKICSKSAGTNQPNNDKKQNFCKKSTCPKSARTN